MRAYRLSVLDQCPIAEGSNAHQAVRNTIDLAKACDAAGFDRYWLAEHHASPALAGVAPEVLMGPLALATSRIRVGSGGIMLPHYSPFKIAETFSLLDAIAPDRIDLGLGRAPGADGRTAYALQRDRSRRIPPDDFPQQVAELLAYLGDGLPDDHPFASLKDSLPKGGAGPRPWMLGSSPDSARWAAEMGLPYCFADFINSDGAAMTRLYRDRFQPSGRLAEPYVMVATWTIAAPTHEEASIMALPSAMMFAHLISGRSIPVPSIETAVAWAAENPAAARRRRRILLGTPQEVHAELDDVAEEYDADELMLVNILPEHAPRRRSYELIAAEYALAPAAIAA